MKKIFLHAKRICALYLPFHNPEACLDIAIVGGGLSGTYAAYTLSKLEWQMSDRLKIKTSNASARVIDQHPRLSLFESRHELGGRLRSRSLDGRTVELGAEYFHRVGYQPREYGTSTEDGVGLVCILLHFRSY